jgi:hypothetical protein
MLQSRKWNGNAKSKLNDLCTLQDQDLDRVTGGVANLPANLEAIINQEHQGGLPLPSPGCRKF